MKRQHPDLDIRRLDSLMLTKKAKRIARTRGVFLELLGIHINPSQVVEGDMVYNTKRLLHPPPSQTNQQNPRGFQ